MTEKNPWLSITEGNVKIAECDVPYFERKGSVEEYAENINLKDDEVELTFDCMPDPFSSSPNSKVYCLNKNPGKPDFCFKEDEAFLNATIQNLRLRSDSCFWAENIRNKCGKVHDGVEWLRKRTKSLKDFLGSNPDIFFIEFFPYHSSKGFAFPKHLPSYDFSDALIKQAVKDKKLIIIMRERINWMKRLKKTIPDIEDYDNLYTLKCAQGGYLTKDNIVHIDNNGEERHLSDEEITRYFKK